MENPSFDLILFDLDGTLSGYKSTDLLPGVAEWFELHRDHQKVAICTNQGGVGLRRWMETGNFGEPAKYPDEFEAYEHIYAVLKQIGGVDRKVPFYVCFAYQSQKTGQWAPVDAAQQNLPMWRQDRRKPASGMLLDAMKDAGALPEHTLMVGDGDEDEQAAAAAGCAFQRADAFFGRAKPSMLDEYRAEIKRRIEVEAGTPDLRAGYQLLLAHWSEVPDQDLLALAAFAFQRRDQVGEFKTHPKGTSS